MVCHTEGSETTEVSLGFPKHSGNKNVGEGFHPLPNFSQTRRQEPSPCPTIRLNWLVQMVRVREVSAAGGRYSEPDVPLLGPPVRGMSRSDKGCAVSGEERCHEVTEGIVLFPTDWLLCHSERMKPFKCLSF